MNLAIKIAEVRKGNGLTQKDFADKLFVTRQAVTRWEKGETTPTVDTIKTIIEMFSLDANDFFDIAMYCQSCAMQLKAFEDMGKNADSGVSTEYCKYCLTEGEFTDDISMEEMAEINLGFIKDFMIKSGKEYDEEKSREQQYQYLSQLKRWKK